MTGRERTRLAVILLGGLGCLLVTSFVFAGPGDLDSDGDVDRNDLSVILAARNTPASGPGDPRDLDGDGLITTLDARILVLLCSQPRCLIDPAVEVLLEEVNRVSGVFDANGGTIFTTASDGTTFDLVIPPGALSESVEVSLTPIISIAGMPLSEGVFAAVRLSPDGLELAEPATLIVELPSADVPEGTLGFLFQNLSEGVQLIPADVFGTTFSFPVSHFSEAGGIDRANTLQSSYVLQAILKYFQLLSQLNTASSCAQTFGILQGVLELVLLDDLAGQAPLTNAITNCGGLAGEVCGSTEDLVDAVSTRLRDVVLPNLTQRADDACRAGDPSKESEVFQCLNAAQVASNSIGVLFGDLLDERLLDIKQCGIDSLNVDPKKLDLAVGAESFVEATALDKSGNVLVGREIVMFSDNQSIAALRETSPAPAGGTRGRVECLLVDTTAIQAFDRIASDAGYVGSPGRVRNDTSVNCGGVIQVDPQEVFLFVDEFAELEANMTDASGKPLPFDMAKFDFFWESKDDTIVEATADPADNSRGIVRAVGGGTADVEVSLRELASSLPKTLATESVKVNVFDMNGDWRVTYTGTDNDCEPPSPLPPPETVTVLQTGSDLTVDNPNFGIDLTGTISKSSNTQMPPYNFFFPPSAPTSQSAACQQFFSDIASFLGPVVTPPCGSGSLCTPLTCLERQAADGILQADGTSATGRVGWEITFTWQQTIFDPDGTISETFTESCEGIDFYAAAKQ